MNKLADISVFESIQNSANARMASPMSVFNDVGSSYPGVHFVVNEGVFSIQNADPVLADATTQGGQTDRSARASNEALVMLRNYGFMMHMTSLLKSMTQDKRALRRLDSLYAECNNIVNPEKFKQPYPAFVNGLVTALSTYDPKTGPAFDIDAVVAKYKPNASAMKAIFTPAKQKQQAELKAARGAVRQTRSNASAQAQPQQAQTQQVQAPAQTQQAQTKAPAQQSQVQAQPQQTSSKGSWWQRAGNAVKRGAKAFGRGVKDAWQSGDQYAY